MHNNPSSDNPNEFELPDAPEFLSKPPRLPFEVSVALIEENLEWTRKQPDSKNSVTARNATLSSSCKPRAVRFPLSN